MIRLTTLTALLALAGAVPLASAQTAEEAPAERVLATVNGKPLTAQMLDFYTQRRLADGSARRDEAGRNPDLMNDLVALEVMAQQAEQQGLHNEPSLQMMIELTRKNLLAQQLMQDHLRDNPVTETELRESYDLIKARVYGAQYHVFHIQVADEPRARELIAQLQGGADFAALAKTESQDPTGERGGELGWLAPSQLPAEFAAALESLQPGGIAEQPVQTSHGWHVLRLAEKRAQPAPSIEESRETLQGLVRNQRLQDFVAQLRAQAKIAQPQ